MTQPAHRRAYTDEAPASPTRWTTFRIGWLVILIVTVVFRAYTLSWWSWLQDDFIFTNGVPGTGFLDYITQDITGQSEDQGGLEHRIPGGLAIAWLMTHFDPLDYTWAAASMCAFSGAVVVGWGLALRELFGERLHLLAALVVLALNPGTTLIAHWWISGIAVLPMQAAMGFCIWFLTRYLRRGRRITDLVWLNVTYVFGLVMYEKSLLITIPLLFVCLVVEAGSFRRSVVTAVRALWPTAVLSAGYLAIYLMTSAGGATAESADGYPRSVESAARMAGNGSVNVVLPALVGGPFGTPVNATTPLPGSGTVLAWFLGLAAVAFLVLGVWFRRRGGLAAAMVVLLAGISWGLVFFSSRFPPFGPELLAAPRYSSDVLPVVLLAAMYLVTPLVGETDPFRRPLAERTRRRFRRLGLVYVVGVCVVVTLTSGRTWHALKPTSSKPYVDTLVASARALGPATVYDTAPPPGVVNGYLMPDTARTSVLLGSLGLPLTYNEPTGDFVMPDDDGRFHPVDIQGDANRSPGPVEGCGYLLDKPGSRAQIPLGGELFPFQWVVEISYYTGKDGRVLVTTDDDEVEMDLPAPEAGEVTHRQLVVTGGISEVAVELLEGKGVCVTGVRAGTAVPKLN